MPDALSKTVPIWAAVMNRVLFPELKWAHELRVPEAVVGGSEKSQIEAMLDAWAQDFRVSAIQDREDLSA